MSRNQLHITKLEEFKSWLDTQNIQHRAGKDFYQVLQVKSPNGFACIYQRNDMKEHYTVDYRLEKIVSQFCRSRNEPKNHRA